MKAIKFIIGVLIVLVPISIVIYTNVYIIHPYIKNENFLIYYVIYSSILTSYIGYQLFLYAIKFNKWFDSKLK